jgi:cytochrome c peroxidase
MVGQHPENITYDRARRRLASQARSRFFLHRGECGACHTPSNGLFTEKGRRPGDEKAGFEDKGRYEVTRKEADVGAFKTPGLRDVSRRAPYMHDGSLKSLEEVIDFYDSGGRSNPWQSPLMRPLGLTAEEKDALLAFLHALDGSGPQDRGPRSFPQ